MNRIEVRKWLQSPPLTGYRALFWVLVFVAIPALLRLAVDGAVTGVALVPFVPFVLLSAIFLNWIYAAAVALASAIVADAFFIGPRPQLLEGPSDIFALSIFVFAAALIIAFVHAVRNLVADDHKPGQQPSGIVFSQEGGEAWAGWYGKSSRMRLGPHDEVAEMMQDFLAQRELAKHLERKAR